MKFFITRYTILLNFGRICLAVRLKTKEINFAFFTKQEVIELNAGACVKPKIGMDVKLYGN